MMQPRIAELCTKCLDQTATPAERQELLQWLATPGQDAAAMELLRNAFLRDKQLDTLTATAADDMVTSILQGHAAAASGADDVSQEADYPTSTPARYRRLFRWSWAAAAILLIIAGAYYYSNRRTPAAGTQQMANGDRQPGRNGAVLILADGSQVVLDDHENGVVATQSGSQVILQDGQLAYDAEDAATGKIVYNTMTTPRGRQFNITLSDGTRVWLNAASSITYPAVFTGDKRQVAITGEAYFEVAKDKTRPFFVTINNKITAQVLGTSFNINAYEEERSLQTTLLEGSLKVMGGDTATTIEQVILQPGQQAQVDNKEIAGTANGPKAHAGTAAGHQTTTGNAAGSKAAAGAAIGRFRVSNANIEKVMAWHRGLFHFEDITVEEAMLQLARWYDVAVIYDTRFKESAVRDQLLSGEIRRDLTLSNVLDLLQALGLHFQLEGSKLTVLP